MKRLNHSRALFVLLTGAAIVACGTETTTSSSSSTPSPGTGSIDPAVPPDASFENMTVDHISINQGVQVTFLEEGALKKSKTPIIPSRPGLVRVHAFAGTTSTTKLKKLGAVGATLHVNAPGRDEVKLDAPPKVLEAFEPGSIDSTFNFDVPAEAIVAGVTLSVEIFDPSGRSTTRTRYPNEQHGDAPIALNVGPLATKLKVRFAPVRYGADGSKRVPLLDDRILDVHKRALYAVYPVAEVEVSVRDAFDWPLQVQPSGQGWDALLSAVKKTRQDDVVADDLYYVGVFNPAPTQDEFCEKAAEKGQGCILGIAPSGMSVAALQGVRVAMILGFLSEARTQGALAQELAHAMGRMHAPCGHPDAIDASFPYDGGSIGTWGYDLFKKELLAPDERVDFMSYCNPVWVSDYTWTGIYNEMVAIDAKKNVVAGP